VKLRADHECPVRGDRRDRDLDHRIVDVARNARRGKSDECTDEDAATDNRDEIDHQRTE
jgi:hypothetical protein